MRLNPLFCILVIAAIVLAMFGLSSSALAEAAAAAPPKPDSGDTAWMIVATALVLLMTIPGLAFFYGGMVQRESVLATLAQSFAVTCLISLLWIAYGYSYAFTEGTQWIGSAGRVMLEGLTKDSLNATIPESVFVMFQMTFAIITCALILGAVTTRIKFTSMLLFVAAWFTVVYVPIAHWVWGPKGLLGGIGVTGATSLFGLPVVLDYAGGTVVHINAGIAGLVAALVAGKGFDFDKKRKNTPPYNIGWSLLGASLLWVGWFGFNAGSAVASNGSAGMAMLVTHVATAAAGLSWMVVEWIKVKKPTVLGVISGAVAGLVAITPASGFVDVKGALVIGAIAGAVCFYGAQLKYKLGYDDTLDVFGVHCIGGITGALLTGVFAVSAIGGTAGVLESHSLAQLWAQLEGVLVTILYCGIVSYIILKIIDMTIGLRVDPSAEQQGLDMALHGEKIH